MLFSLLKGVDFFGKSLKESGKNHPCAVHKGDIITLISHTNWVTLKFWYKHRYPQNLGGGGGSSGKN
jgi:hypothetical protein